MSATFIIEATVKPGLQQQFIDSFEVMKQAPGFKAITLYQDDSSDQNFLCIEEWESKQDHQNFVEATTKEDAEAWLALLASPPKAKMYQQKVRIEG